MRAPVVIEMDPVADHRLGLVQRFESMSMHALLLERADHALDRPVLLGAVRSDELLAQPVASDQRRKAAAGEHQAVVRTQQERYRHPTRRAEPRDQCLLQRRLRRLRSLTSR